MAFEREVLIHNVSDSVTNTVYRGVLFDEVQQVFKEYYSQTWRVFNSNHTKDLRFVQNNIHLGPLDQGAEFITYFRTNLVETQINASNNYTGTIWTGQNALEFVKRDYTPYVDEIIAGLNVFLVCAYWFSVCGYWFSVS